MMTKTTLKALYLGGGGLLATWLAVTPNHGAPTSATTTVQQSDAFREVSAEQLNAQTDRLRARTSAIALRPSKRNPFRFSASRAPFATEVRTKPIAAATIQPVPVLPPAPSLTLTGITEKKTPDGLRRTAVISSGGQLFLAGEGQSVVGGYTVVAIDPDAVLLRDASGVELRLGLR